MNRKHANILLFIAAIIWGGGFLATDFALQDIPPFYIMSIRFLGASIIPLLFSIKRIHATPKKMLLHGCVCGIILFFAFAFQTFGLQYSTPSTNAFLTSTNVIFIPIILWLLTKRVPQRNEWISSVICLVGIALLTLNTGMNFIGIGDIFSIICAVFFAIHIIALNRFSKRWDTLSLSAIQLLIAGLFSFLCAQLYEMPPTSIGNDAWLGISYMIFISTLLAYLLQTHAQKYTSANTASIILSTEALFAAIFAFLILQERLSVQMLLGAAIILLSLIYMEYQAKRN